MLGAVGCANKDVVKKDEPIAVKQTTVNPSEVATTGTESTSDQKKAEADNTIVPSISTASAETVKPGAGQNSFEQVYFNFDSSDLDASARTSLNHNAEIMLIKQKTAKLRIEGNCDERGSAEYNLALGERRAKAAAKYLTALGVPSERVATISYGKERPAVTGSDEVALGKNRRDEFVAQM
jgi:peptidoglycan-associated lipoprotein